MLRFVTPMVASKHELVEIRAEISHNNFDKG